MHAASRLWCRCWIGRSGIDHLKFHTLFWLCFDSVLTHDVFDYKRWLCFNYNYCVCLIQKLLMSTLSFIFCSLQFTITTAVHATDAYFQLRHLQQHAKDVLTVAYLELVSRIDCLWEVLTVFCIFNIYVLFLIKEDAEIIS